MTKYFVFAIFFLFAMPAKAAPESFADLAEKLTPAVVNISTTQKVELGRGRTPFNFDALPNHPGFEEFRKFFKQFEQPRDKEVSSLGSGFIINEDGTIITNNHVIAEADEIKVILQDDSEYEAQVIGRDEKTDIAVLKIEAGKKLSAVKFGDSDKVRVGDWIVAIGNPFGLGGTVTAGIISARARDINATQYDDFLQTDAAINRGNSGGPMFNMSGEVIGINTAIFSPSGGNIGIGFATPSALAKPVIEQLQKFGETRRGWLGVRIQHVTDEIAESLNLGKARGALVIEVAQNGPSADSGIQPGDIIIEFNGEAIDKMRKLPRVVADTEIGSRVNVKVWRDGGVRSFRVKLGKLSDAQEKPSPRILKSDKKTKDYKTSEILGLKLVAIDSEIREDFGIDDKRGLLVLDVERSSPAGIRGLKRGDVIVSVNNIGVKSLRDMSKLLARARDKNKQYVMLAVNRAGVNIFLTLPLDEIE